MHITKKTTGLGDSKRRPIIGEVTFDLVYLEKGLRDVQCSKEHQEKGGQNTPVLLISTDLRKRNKFEKEKLRAPRVNVKNRIYLKSYTVPKAQVEGKRGEKEK